MNEEEFRDWIWDHWFELGDEGYWTAKLVVGLMTRTKADDAVLVIKYYEAFADKRTSNFPNNPIHKKTLDGARKLLTLLELSDP